MKKITFLMLACICACSMVAQHKVTYKNGVIRLKLAQNNAEQILVSDSGEEENLTVDILTCPDKKDIETGKIFYTTNCTDEIKSIRFYPNKGKPNVNAVILYFCDKKFTDVKCSEVEGTVIEETTETDENKAITRQIYQIPFPHFSPDNNDSIRNRSCHRYLLIDASSSRSKKTNNSLFKPTKKFLTGKTFNEKFKNAYALHVNGSLEVFIRNYRFHDLESVTVSVNGEDYEYTMDLDDIIGKKTPSEATTPKDSIETTSTAEDTSTYLQMVLDTLKTYNSLNLNDLYAIQQYKDELRASQEENGADLDVAQIELLSKIYSWFPQYLSLTPIATLVPDNDEVLISVSIKNKEVEANSYDIGRYRTTGGITVGVGTMLYYTNLKNNEIYTKTEPGDEGDELHAKINQEDQSSLGVGLNGEVFFRTGSLFRPTINLGAFIPFDEEISPIVTLGPGISIAGKRVKFSISYGIAYGKMNEIKEQYRNEDLTGLDLTNETLTDKVWKQGYYWGVGLRFNLSDGSKSAK